MELKQKFHKIIFSLTGYKAFLYFLCNYIFFFKMLMIANKLIS